MPRKTPTSLPLTGARAPGWPVACALIFVLALGARAALGVFEMSRTHDPRALRFPDEQWYWRTAESVHRGEGLVGEFGHRAARMPLYPAILSVVAGASDGVIYARAGQWVLGAMGAVLAAMLGARIAGRTVGLIAGLLVACDPGLAGIASLLLTETLFITLLTAWWLVGWPLTEPPGSPPEMAQRRSRRIRWVVTGVLASACVYTRPAAIALVPAWGGFVWGARRFDARVLVASVALVAAVIVSLIPWAARNRSVTGRWCWLTTRAGISLYDGVHPEATGASALAEVKDSPAVRGLSEPEWDRYFRERSWQAIRDEPARIARLGLVKLARTWSPVLHAEEYHSTTVRLVFAACSLIFYVLAGIGLIARRRSVALCAGLLLPAFWISCVQFFYVGSVRYRLAAVPMLAVLAAAGAMTLFERMRRSPNELKRV